jgi:hypothetical protein
MPLSRILLLAAASCAFLLMLSSVTASSDFLYAPESAWKASSDSAQDVAVAAWESRTSRSAAPVSSASSAGDSSSVPAPHASSAPAASSSPTVSSAPAPSSAPSSVDDGVPKWAKDWWKRFGDDKERKGRKGRDQ